MEKFPIFQANKAMKFQIWMHLPFEAFADELVHTIHCESFNWY